MNLTTTTNDFPCPICNDIIKNVCQSDGFGSTVHSETICPRGHYDYQFDGETVTAYINVIKMQFSPHEMNAWTRLHWLTKQAREGFESAKKEKELKSALQSNLDHLVGMKVEIASPEVKKTILQTMTGEYEKQNSNIAKKLAAFMKATW